METKLYIYTKLYFRIAKLETVASSRMFQNTSYFCTVKRSYMCAADW
jgi:hypothetical protein